MHGLAKRLPQHYESNVVHLTTAAIGTPNFPRRAFTSASSCAKSSALEDNNVFASRISPEMHSNHPQYLMSNIRLHSINGNNRLPLRFQDFLPTFISIQVERY